MRISTSILVRLQVGPATMVQLRAAMPTAGLKSIATTTSNLRKQGWLSSQRIRPSGNEKLYQITDAGRAELRRLGHFPGSEPASLFGSFGSHLKQVPSVFHLGGILK